MVVVCQRENMLLVNQLQRLFLLCFMLVVSLKQMDIKDLLISVPQKDIHNQLWNTNAPVYKSGQTETIRKILSVFPDAHYIMDGLYNSQDEEYLDGKELDKLVTKK